MQKSFIVSLLALVMVFTALPGLSAHAEEDINSEIDIEEVGAEASEVDAADEEESINIREIGSLIEIGNTTAEQTTIIVRVNRDGVDEDLTLEINADTKVYKSNDGTADLSDWIAGDRIGFTAEQFTNSDQLVATALKNLSFAGSQTGINGWIKDIRIDEEEIDVEWGNKIYTITTDDARMVAGLKNPATIEDFKIGDRVRARVKNDGDGSRLTWDGEIIVVLRRGSTLFMRVTRWVVPGVIVAMPDDLTLPTTIDVEVLDSKFYEEGDVNNLVGTPGTIIQVDVTEDTELVRRYLGNTNLNEFSEGDVVRVIGRRDENTGHLTAKVVKNNNIQKLGVANKEGKVIAVDASNLIVTAEVKTGGENKEYTVIADNDTAIIKLGQEVSFSDIVVGDHIRVRGTFRRSDSTVVVSQISIIVRRDDIPEDIHDIDVLKDRFKLQIKQLKEETDRFRDLLKDRMDAFHDSKKQLKNLQNRLRKYKDDSSDDHNDNNDDSNDDDDSSDDDSTEDNS